MQWTCNRSLSYQSPTEKEVNSITMNTKLVLLLVLPCIIAMVTSRYVQYGYGGSTYPVQQGAGQYVSYASNSVQALRQARLFNYLLGGLYFLNLFNVTGNRIAG